MLQQILIRLPISDRGCASLLRAPLQIPFQTIRGTSAHARYLGIDHAKTQCTLTKNKKNAMSPERATPQHAYVQRFVSHLCTQEKFVKTDGTAACLNASLHYVCRRRALYCRVVDTRLRAQFHLPVKIHRRRARFAFGSGSTIRGGRHTGRGRAGGTHVACSGRRCGSRCRR